MPGWWASLPVPTKWALRILFVGILGKMANMHQFLMQLTGVAVVGRFAFTSSLLIFWIIKKAIGIRVTEEHELAGLDSHEHGIRGYTTLVE